MRPVRPLLACALLLACAAALPAQARLRVAPSGRATTAVTLSYPRDSAPPGFQPLAVKIDYGQPHLRGRTLHTDSTFVPYDRPWRTGANEPTTLTTGADLDIGGHAIPKGTYTLWTLPTRAGWTLIVQRPVAPGSPQSGVYDAANDVARIPLRVQSIPVTVESLTMWLVPTLAPGSSPRGDLRIAWATTLLETEWSVR